MTKTSAASLITPAQAADLLNISTSSLRRYSRQFKKHLSQYAKGKRRQYTQDDLATLTRARDYIRGGNNAQRTNILLATITPGDEKQLPVAAAMSHAELVSAFQVVGEQFAIMQETQTANREQIAALTARLDALQARSFVDRLLNRIPATA